MSDCWITPDGNYYEGPLVSGGSVSVPHRPSELHDFVDGEWMFNLSRAKGARLLELNAVAQSLADQALAAYPEFETKTWEDQRREATAWSADNDVSTPYIDALSLFRGLDRVDYINRTLAKIASFTAFSTRTVGIRQLYADRISAAVDAETLNAIVFDFS